MAEIEARVKAIIVDKLGVDESEVTPNASFTNDLGADSLDTVELIIFNFSFFGITGWGIDLDYCDIEWFALETNRDHSVIFEIASKY